MKTYFLNLTVKVPRRSGGDGRFGGGDAELLCRSISVYR